MPNDIKLNYYHLGTAEGRIDFDGEEYQFKFEVVSLKEREGDFVSIVECLEDEWMEVLGMKLTRIVPQIVKELQPKLFELIDQSIAGDNVDRVYEQEKDRRMMLDRRDSARQILANGKAVVE